MLDRLDMLAQLVWQADGFHECEVSTASEVTMFGTSCTRSDGMRGFLRGSLLTVKGGCSLLSEFVPTQSNHSSSLDGFTSSQTRSKEYEKTIGRVSLPYPVTNERRLQFDAN